MVDGLLKPDIVAPGNKNRVGEAVGASLTANYLALHASGVGNGCVRDYERDKYATGVVSGAVVRVADDPSSGVEPDLLNSTLTATAISLQSGRRVVAVLRGHLLWLALNYFGGASVALLVDSHSTTVSVTTISIVLPLLLLTYLIHDGPHRKRDQARRPTQSDVHVSH